MELKINKIKTKEISFCDKTSDNITTTDDKAIILNFLKENYGIEISYRSAMMVNNNILKNLEKNVHLIATKSSGTNYFLFMLRINEINYCFYIDRKIKQGYSYPRIISTKYRFHDSIFNGTLLEGELVKDLNNNWQFLISDLLVYKGERQKSNIVIRFNKLHNMLTNFYKVDSNLEICPLRIKELFTYNKLDFINDSFIPNLPYKTRGLYFLTLNTKHSNYLYLFQNIPEINMVKKSEKPFIEKVKINQAEIDKDQLVLGMKKTMNPDIYDLYINKDAKLSKFNIAYIPTLAQSKRFKKIFKNTDLEMITVRCRYSENFKKWEPLEQSDETISSI